MSQTCPKAVTPPWNLTVRARTLGAQANGASRLEFRILGPLVVRVDGAAVPIGGPKQRALLALLLLSANRVVSRDVLMRELFAEQSVNSADHALRNHVSRLRKVLMPGAADEPRLVARRAGVPASGRAGRARSRALRAARRRGPGVARRRRCGDGRRHASSRRGDLGRAPARGPRVRAVRPRGRRAARGAPAGRARGAPRCRSHARQAARARCRARGARARSTPSASASERS